ncbi:MAG: ABC transporter permease [Thermoplasmata archaeon]
MPSSASRVGPVAGAVLSASLLALFVLPLVALFAYVGGSGLAAAVGDAAFWTAVEFTLLASAIAVALGLATGVPLGYLLARRRFPGRKIVESIVLLPVVIPHLVVGIALLLLVAPSSPVGALLVRIGLPVFDAIAGVVLVMLYVGGAYVVLASQQAFRAVDEETIECARALGASPAEAFATVTLPAAARGIATGALLMWARGVSEIGGFLILAYAVLPGPPWFGPVTAPASVYIWDLYNSAGGLEPAAAASCLLVLVALAIFLAVRWIDRRTPSSRPGGWFS